MSTFRPAAPDAGIDIRLIRPDEYDRAAEVTSRAYEHAYGELAPSYLASLRDVAGRMQHGDVWVAIGADGDMLGTVWVARPNRPLSDLALPGETDFRQLAVAPEAAGRGIGAALTRHVVDLARARGSHRVVMNSSAEMTGAHALYERLGFTRMPEREHPWEVEPGRILELLAFGYDLAPTPATPPSATERPRWTVVSAAWDDPRAVALRDAMDREVGPRYADRLSAVDPAVAAAVDAVFAIDPATLIDTLLVLSDDGEPLAHGTLRDLRHDGIRDVEIKRVYVDPRARGRGASRVLLAELERRAEARGATRVILQTGDRQPDAVALYERLGYTPIPIYEPYTALDFSICMEKALTPDAAS